VDGGAGDGGGLASAASRCGGRIVEPARGGAGRRGLHARAAARAGSRGAARLARRSGAGGDPWVPPALRAAPAERSPEGAALEALVQRKIAERRANPWR
jgi:hypothetical protein